MAPGFSSRHSAPQNRSHSPSSNSPSATESSTRPHFGAINHNSIMAANSRSGAGSPSHDMPGSSRLYLKRAREIQAQEGIPGLPINPWGGPPTSGNSTPLRENIPESPTDGFPDFAQLPMPESMPQTRRARAGTVPSRFSPGSPPGGLLPVPNLAPKSARATPSQTPFNKSPSPGLEPLESSSGGSALLSCLRAGSMPQRSPFPAMPNSASPFGPFIFSSWNPAGVGRDRGSTLASIASVGSNAPSSPSQSHFSKEGGGESDVHMRTLDYLGLAETPQPTRAQIATPYMANLDYTKQSSRFRSYSVNNKDKYADDEDYEVDGVPMESQYVAALQDQLAATNAAIHNHNLAVQAFANQASATRPRARTAGVLESPGGRLMRTYLTGNTTVPNPIASSADMRMQDNKEFDDLPQALVGMSLGRSSSRNAGLLGAEEQGLEGPTSALWLGGIPTSTTTSTLVEMFKGHGPILSARALTHKNCDFVNFERVESAISTKSSLNSKEIFPGAGPIRINFAKPPSTANTPGHDGVLPSPSPDPFAKAQDAVQAAASATADGAQASTLVNSTPAVPPLRDLSSEIVNIVGRFGASEDEKLQTSRSVQSAIQYDAFVEEIPAIREPTHTRVHDAPRLRDIRKRIDNQILSQAEIEGVAMEMLPEIAELSSDYLGNTVVQKLFEHCTDPVRDAMLAEIAPHLAEIGIHKNGTWAAQKIIDVCKTPGQMSVIVEHLRPCTVPLFLDQYGNYVLQGCLKFGTPYNEFIFETILNKMWEVSQGRFGARAMRACLESHHASKNQQRMLAAAIALHSVQLATNANGALLLTWFLDTCTFPQRRTVLSPRLVSCLVHLCTHKVAYLTVLKVINQKAEADARDTILKSLFFSPNDQVLEAILNDHACGSTLIFKVLTTPFFDESIRSQVLDNVKNVLVKIKAQPGQGYKRLMNEVGLSTRTAAPNREANAHPDQRQRPTSRQADVNSQNSQQGHGGKAFFNPLNPTTLASGFDASYGPQRNDGADANIPGLQPFNQGIMYGTPTGSVSPAVNLQQIQYQQSMLNRATPTMNYTFPPLQPRYEGFGSPGPAVDQFRQQNMSNGSPIQPPSTQVPYGPPGFALPLGSPYGYGGIGGMQSMGYMQQEQANARRGRR